MLQKAVAYSETFYLIYIGRADDAIRSGNEDEGIEYLMQVMRHAPDSYHAGICADRAVDMLRDKGKYREAIQMLEAFRNYMERSQVPYWNFMKGELCLQMHRPDSALHYFRIATVAGNRPNAFRHLWHQPCVRQQEKTEVERET